MTALGAVCPGNKDAIRIQTSSAISGAINILVKIASNPQAKGQRLRMEERDVGGGSTGVEKTVYCCIKIAFSSSRIGAIIAVISLDHRLLLLVHCFYHS